MSRTVVEPRIPDPPEGLELSPIPNIRMASGAAEWIAEHLAIPVSERYVRVKSNERMIRYSIIQGVRHYSSQSLYEFIMSTEKKASA